MHQSWLNGVLRYLAYSDANENEGSALPHSMSAIYAVAWIWFGIRCRIGDTAEAFMAEVVVEPERLSIRR
jgi:hypothetical protein